MAEGALKVPAGTSAGGAIVGEILKELEERFSKGNKQKDEKQKEKPKGSDPADAFTRTSAST